MPTRNASKCASQGGVRADWRIEGSLAFEVVERSVVGIALLLGHVSVHGVLGLRSSLDDEWH
jgi:hypothetical protein